MQQLSVGAFLAPAGALDYVLVGGTGEIRLHYSCGKF
jgi:hypothetical protein